MGAGDASTVGGFPFECYGPCSWWISNDAGVGNVSEFRSERNAAVEVSRFAAAIGIVLFHAKLLPGIVADAGVGYFAIVMVVFLLKHEHRTTDLGASIRERAHRLLVPWLKWSLFYAALKFFQAVVEHRSLAAEFRPWLPHVGTQDHLWFLPWAFGISVVLIALCGIGRRTLPFAAAACLALPWTGVLDLLDGQFHNFARFLPAVGAGIVLASLGRGRMIASIALLGLGLLMQWASLPGSGQLVFGAPLAGLSIYAISFRSIWMEQLGAMSLNIYLVHPFFIAVLINFANFQLGTVALAMPVVLATIAASYMVLHSAWVMRQLREILTVRA